LKVSALRHQQVTMRYEYRQPDIAPVNAQPPRISRPDDDDYRQERRQLIFLVAALLALSLILLASVLT
jgi:hypothetical protein